MLVSIVIPTKDEPYIQELIDELKREITQNFEIIIVDKSEVRPIVEGARVISQKSDGLGNAFAEGLGQAGGDVIALMDGDGSHRPEDLNKLLSEIGDYEIALGSKLMVGANSADTFARKAVTLAFSLLTRLILWVDIKDPMTGFMVAKRDIFNRIELKPRGYKVVIEIVYKSKARVVEVPIKFRERKLGTSKAGFNTRGTREVLRIIILLLDLRWGRLTGKW
jgi:dolichol-phosphate mannosyltransferase